MPSISDNLVVKNKRNFELVERNKFVQIEKNEKIWQLLVIELFDTVLQFTV